MIYKQNRLNVYVMKTKWIIFESLKPQWNCQGAALLPKRQLHVQLPGSPSRGREGGIRREAGAEGGKGREGQRERGGGRHRPAFGHNSHDPSSFFLRPSLPTALPPLPPSSSSTFRFGPSQMASVYLLPNPHLLQSFPIVWLSLSCPRFPTPPCSLPRSLVLPVVRASVST